MVSTHCKQCGRHLGSCYGETCHQCGWSARDEQVEVLATLYKELARVWLLIVVMAAWFVYLMWW